MLLNRIDFNHIYILIVIDISLYIIVYIVTANINRNIIAAYYTFNGNIIAV